MCEEIIISDTKMILTELTILHHDMIVRNAYDIGILSENDYRKYIMDEMKVVKLIATKMEDKLND